MNDETNPTDPMLELESLADRKEQILNSLRAERITITARLEEIATVLGKPKRTRTRKVTPGLPKVRKARAVKNEAA
jgi:hypothetical protein